MKKEWLRPLEQTPHSETTASLHALSSNLTSPQKARDGGGCHMETDRLTSTPGQQQVNRSPPGGDAAAGNGVMMAWQRHMTDKIDKVLTRTEDTAIEIASVRQLIVRVEGLLEDSWRAQAAADHKGTTPSKLQLSSSRVATFGSPSIAEGDFVKDMHIVVSNSAEAASELRVVREQVNRVEDLLCHHKKQPVESGVASGNAARPEGHLSPELSRRLETMFQEKIDEMQQMHAERLDEIMNFCIQNKESELGMRDLFVACQEAVQRMKDWKGSEENLHVQSLRKEAFPMDKQANIWKHLTSSESSLPGHAMILETANTPDKPPAELRRELQDIEEDDDERAGLKQDPAVRRCSQILFWISTVLVILNVIFMGLKVTVAMPSARDGHEAPAWSLVGEHMFTVAFVIELLSRLALEKRRFFTGSHAGWNVLDAVLVIFQVFETIHGLGNYTIIRIALLGKVVRVTRLFRVVKNFRHFRLMAMTGAWQPLFWGCIVLVAFIFLFALLTTQLVEIALAKKVEAGEKVPGELLEFYGSLGKSMVSLFMGITGGLPWKHLLDPLQAVSPGISNLVFLAYIFVMTFGVLNTVSAVYIDGLLHCSDQSRFVAMSESALFCADKYAELKQIFQARDLNNNGRITYVEFSDAIHHPDTQELLGTLHFEAHTIMALFRLLEDETDCCSVRIDEFIRCLQALQEGGVNILLMSTLVFRGQTLLKNISRNADMMEKHFSKVEDGIHNVEAENMELLTAHWHQHEQADANLIT